MHLESAACSVRQQIGECSRVHSASGEGIPKPASKHTTASHLKESHADVDVSYVPSLVVALGGSK